MDRLPLIKRYLGIIVDGMQVVMRIIRITYRPYTWFGAVASRLANNLT